jgi:hypothetical protein
MRAGADATAARSRRSIVLGSVVAVAVMLIVGIVLNEPVGGATRVRGNLEANCVPRGKQSNSYDCTAKLADGSRQIFQQLRSLRGGTSVTFLRRDRKYIGRHYELASVAP